MQADVNLFAARGRVTAAATAARRVAVYENRAFPEAGGLASYGADIRENFRQGALYVDRILRGAHPSELPVVQRNRPELVLNAGAAARLGLQVAPTLLARLDEVFD